MRPTHADLTLWQYYKRPRFAATITKDRRPSIHSAINARGPKEGKRASSYGNTLHLLLLARRNYRHGDATLRRMFGDPPTFREYVAKLALNGDTPERRAYCARIVRRLQEPLNH